MSHDAETAKICEPRFEKFMLAGHGPNWRTACPLRQISEMRKAFMGGMTEGLILIDEGDQCAAVNELTAFFGHRPEEN